MTEDPDLILGRFSSLGLASHHDAAGLVSQALEDPAVSRLYRRLDRRELAEREPEVFL
jgi:hypothetical protein